MWVTHAVYVLPFSLKEMYLYEHVPHTSLGKYTHRLFGVTMNLRSYNFSSSLPAFTLLLSFIGKLQGLRLQSSEARLYLSAFKGTGREGETVKGKEEERRLIIAAGLF